MGKYTALAKEIIKNVGGKENVSALSHCVTRLRFVLKDESKTNTDVLKNMDGVVTVIQSAGQYQVVIGNHVADVYDDVCAVGGIAGGEASETDEKKSLKDSFFDMVTGIFMPSLAVMTGAGMLKGFLALFVFFGWLSDTSGLYTSAKKSKMDPMLGLATGAALMYPALQNTDLEIFGHIFNVSYSGTVLPIILTNALAAWMYKKLNKVIPDVIKTFSTPLVVLAVAAPIGFLIICPTATLISEWLLNGILTVYGFSPILAGLLIGGLWQVMVIFGVHTIFAITAIITLMSGAPTPIFALNFCASFAQMATVFAIWLKTKDQKLKNIALPAWISTFCGGTEPAIYDVTLPRIKQFVITWIGSALGSMYIGMTGLLYHQMAGMGIFALPGFIEIGGDAGSALLNVGIALLISVGFSFVASYFTYKDEETVPSTVKAGADVKTDAAITISAPLAGEVKPLSAIQDEAFAQGLLGKGVYITPSDSKVYAPVSGTVTTLFPTEQAIGITSPEGVLPNPFIRSR